MSDYIHSGTNKMNKVEAYKHDNKLLLANNLGHAKVSSLKEQNLLNTIATVQQHSNKITQLEVDVNKVKGAYVYKGTVETEFDLPLNNNSVGDVYNVSSTDMNYAWNGENWDKLGGIIDIETTLNHSLELIQHDYQLIKLKGNTYNPLIIQFYTETDYNKWLVNPFDNTISPLIILSKTDDVWYDELSGTISETDIQTFGQPYAIAVYAIVNKGEYDTPVFTHNTVINHNHGSGYRIQPIPFEEFMNSDAYQAYTVTGLDGVNTQQTPIYLSLYLDQSENEENSISFYFAAFENINVGLSSEINVNDQTAIAKASLDPFLEEIEEEIRQSVSNSSSWNWEELPVINQETTGTEGYPDAGPSPFRYNLTATQYVYPKSVLSVCQSPSITNPTSPVEILISFQLMQPINNNLYYQISAPLKLKNSQDSSNNMKCGAIIFPEHGIYMIEAWGADGILYKTPLTYQGSFILEKDIAYIRQVTFMNNEHISANTLLQSFVPENTMREEVS